MGWTGRGAAFFILALREGLKNEHKEREVWFASKGATEG